MSDVLLQFTFWSVSLLPCCPVGWIWRFLRMWEQVASSVLGRVCVHSPKICYQSQGKWMFLLSFPKRAWERVGKLTWRFAGQQQRSMCAFHSLFNLLTTFFSSLFLIFYWFKGNVAFAVRYRIWFPYTHIHSSLGSFPVQVITESWVDPPLLHSKPLLTTCFICTNIGIYIYMSLKIFLGV